MKRNDTLQKVNALFRKCCISLFLFVLILFICSIALGAESLRNGDSGDDVRALQQKLIDLHFLTGTADGKFGTLTENALRAFQKKNGLCSDGIAGQKTMNKLNSITNEGTGKDRDDPQATAPEVGLFSNNYTTLRKNCSGSRVTILQNALFFLNYLTEKADGKYGTATEKAVIQFQRSKGLAQDGVAGKKTLKALEEAFAQAKDHSQSKTESQKESKTAADTETSTKSDQSDLSFGNNYATIRKGASGERVITLQTALKKLKYYNGQSDGKFGTSTEKAVILFQKSSGLTPDGLAGKKTLKALESALKKNKTYSGQEDTPQNDKNTRKTSTTSVKAPDQSQIRLLHWFDDIKPNLKNGQHILVYDPSTKISWTLRLMSLGRHADAEPLTLQDTNNMVRAFGNKNTWNQKAVYVRLPDGVWTVASTHDMPHLSGHIKDNGFDGHLCVHFLRDMSEAQKNDPSYGVANQKTIREMWKSLTGETITD